MLVWQMGDDGFDGLAFCGGISGVGVYLSCLECLVIGGPVSNNLAWVFSFLVLLEIEGYLMQTIPLCHDSAGNNRTSSATRL